MKWWEGFLTENQEIKYVSFKIKDTEVLIGPRLISKGTDPSFFQSIQGFLVVTESYIEYPPTANVRWFPWLEGTKEFPEEVLFGGLKTLNNWINELKLNKIYIHCDLGSHRAPSILGAFLKAYFTDQESNKIINNADISHAQNYYWKFDQLMNHPLKYIETKFQLVPTLPYLIKAIIDNPNNDLSTILSRDLPERLPDHLISKDQLKERIIYRNRISFYKQAKDELISYGFSIEEKDLVSNISDFTANLNGKDYRINLINIPNEKVFNPNISYALADGVPLYIVYPSIKKLIVKYHTKNIIKTKINLKLNGVSIQEIKKK